MSSTMGTQERAIGSLVASVTPQKQKSINQHIVNLMQGSLKYGDGKSIANTSILVTVTMVILLIGIIIQYSKAKLERTKKWRLTPAIFLGTGGTLLYGCVSMAAIAYKPKIMSRAQQIILLFTILMFTYFYAVYCIFPLSVYVKSNENIYDDDHDQTIIASDDVVDHHHYEKAVDIITLITNILVICTMIYIVYLLLWHRDAVVLKRQLLVIAVVFGVKVGKSVKDIIDKTVRK